MVFEKLRRMNVESSLGWKVLAIGSLGLQPLAWVGIVKYLEGLVLVVG